MGKKNRYGRIDEGSGKPSGTEKSETGRKKKTKKNASAVAMKKADAKNGGKKDGKKAEGKKKNASPKKERNLSEICLEGTLVTNRKGFGFVTVEELDEDIFIPHSGLNGAFHKDTVRVRLVKGHGRRQEGVVEKILERGITTVIGTYQEHRGHGFVIPDDQKIADDIHIARAQAHGAKDGCKAVVLITEYGDRSRKPEGEIVEILGMQGDPGVDIVSIVRGYGLPTGFREDVIEASEKVPEKVGAAEANARLDLRGVQMVTIDGEDTKDLDDAVSLSKKGFDYILGVHIADVSHYVTEGSVLDKEALERGNSVYLVDRVIPMLPGRLSNGICSLNAGEDRLAMSCIMHIGRSGKLKSYEIRESVINVDRRMTYTDVAKIIEDHDPETIAEYRELVPMFEKMASLAAVLKKMRTKRGSIDFDLPESKILLDENGHVREIKPYDRNAATQMIEQFMLSANEAVAAHMHAAGIPALYRIHETPDADRMHDLMELLRSFGYHVKGDAAHIAPKEVQKLLSGTEGRQEEDLIRTLALRSMKQARYDTECVGHFGLAASEYTHFTSPIRRYSDLQIHRILKEEAHGMLSEKRIAHYEKILGKVAKQCSERERRAVDAERDTDRLKCSEYMEDHIGETYRGQISGVTGWGVYVQLTNTVEGMIPISKMPGDDYDYSEREYAVIGRYTGRQYRLGEHVTIRVERVDLVLRTIDFSLIPEE